MYLLYDYQNHNWIFLNEDGKNIFDSIKEGMNAERIVELISQKYSNQSSQEIANKVKQFIKYLIEMEFVFLNEYIPKPPPALKERKGPNGCSIVFEKCNLNCIYCYNKVTRTKYQKKYRDMTTGEFKMALDQLIDLGVQQMLFSGGEPTLRKDINELARFVKNKNSDVFLALITNGTRINKENAKEFSEIFDLIWVSLDSHKKEEHEALRGKGTYDKTVSAIKLFLEAGARNLLVNSMVSDFNYKSMSGTRAFVLDELGAHQFRMSEYQPFKNIGDSESDLKLNPPPDSFKFGDKGLMTQADIDNIGLDELEKQSMYLMPRIHCGVAHGEISLHSSGDVYPCQNFTDEIFKCGNVLTETIDKIYNESPIMKKLRDATIYCIEPCNECEVKYICHGSCRASAYEIYGSLLAHCSGDCAVHKKRAIERLWRMPAVPFKKAEEIRKNK